MSEHEWCYHHDGMAGDSAPARCAGELSTSEYDHQEERHYEAAASRRHSDSGIARFAGEGVPWRRFDYRGNSLYKPRNKSLAPSARAASNAAARLEPPTPPCELAEPVTVPGSGMSEEELPLLFVAFLSFFVFPWPSPGERG